MKTRIAALSILAAALTVAQAAPRRVALVVQDHTSGALPVPAEALADTFAVLLSGAELSVVNPANRIGTVQNRTAAGESMPEAAVVEMANLLGTDGVITASVQEFASQSIGVPAVGRTVKARIALTLADRTTGATVCGIAARDYGRNYTAGQWEADAEALREDFLHEAAAAAATRFLAAYRAAEWPDAEPEKVTVFFGCNVLGADIQIDGLSYGTTPAQIAVTPGVHRLLVSYPPYYFDYNRSAMFNTEGQTFAVVLQITPEGEEQRMRQLEYDTAAADSQDSRGERGKLFERQLELADAMLERYGLSGETDDYVRRTIADGTSLYWKNSYGRVVITDGTAQDIELATPVTDAGDLSVPPDPNEIGEGLQKLLKAARR